MNAAGDDIWDWRWPEKGLDKTALEAVINGIKSPYEGPIPPICYPGTPLPKHLTEKIALLVPKHINAVGSHTHGIKGEGGFETIQKIEAQVIWMVASMIGGSPKTVDGYFCGGGTEANIEVFGLVVSGLIINPTQITKVLLS